MSGFRGTHWSKMPNADEIRLKIKITKIANPKTWKKGRRPWNGKNVDRKYYDKDWLYQKYIIDELTGTDIAKIVGCNRHCIARWLRELGISVRKNGQASKGYKQRMSGKNHPNYNPVGGYVTAKRRGYGNKYACVICGWKEATCDIHHKNGKEIDTFDNLTILCPNHHRMAHRNLIDTTKLPDLKTIVGTQS